MTATVRGGLRLLLPFLLLPLFAACGNEKEEEQEQKEPTVLSVSGTASCSPVVKSLEFTVQCDLKWTATIEGADWARIDSQTVLGDGGSVVIGFDTNHGEGDRTGTLVVTSGTKSYRRNFTQGGLYNFFIPRELHLAGTEEVSLVFDSPYAWKASVAEGADWIDFEATEGIHGFDSVRVAAKDPNENVGDRSGSLIITIAGEDYTIPVVQSQKDIILTEDTDVSFDYKGGDFTVITRSNVSYEITCSAEWVRHIDTKALNVAQESFTVSANESAEDRSATIRFAPKEGDAPAVTVKVLQSGKDPILNIFTPGAYGIDGEDYILGHNGWNQSGRVLKADGSFVYRLLNRSALKVLNISGITPSYPDGSTCRLEITVRKKSDVTLSGTCDALIIGSSEELLWLKASDETYFIIQK